MSFRPSITTKVSLTILLTIFITAGGAYWSASALIQQLATLNQDARTDHALIKGRQGLFQLHKVRQQLAVIQLVDCVKNRHMNVCPIVEGTAQIKPADNEEDGDLPLWNGEDEVRFVVDDKQWRATTNWPKIRPEFENTSEILKTRAHLKELSPKITSSFRSVFAGVMTLACLLGLAGAFLIASSIRRRVSSLTSYADRLATGLLEPAPLSTRGGDEVGILAQAMESMATDLNQMKEKLIYAEKINSWQAVAKKVAHEIKNPLTPISLVADHIEQFGDEQRAPDPNVLKEAARILREEIGALDRMVQEFSSFARLPKPKLQVEDLNQMVADFINRNPENDKISWEFTAHREPCSVDVDNRMIFQILHNLTNNAKLACDPSPVTIRISVTKGDSFAVLTFRDNGPGIPDQIKDSLFDAYVTTRSTGEKERGMGLGLAISRKIAEDHQGSLKLTDTGPQGGTEFALLLPVLKDKP